MTPSPPDGWERLVADLQRTTGHVMTFGIDSVCDELTITIDGRQVAGLWRSYSPDPLDHLAAFIGDLQELILDEFVGGGWPICPRHHTHPLEATVVRAEVVWKCPVDDVAVASVGSLAEVG